MPETFKKEITFIDRTFHEDQINNGAGGWVEEEITKTATFKELCRTDKDQHKLHFKIMSLFSQAEPGEDDTKEIISSDGLYDLTAKTIKILLVPDADFTEQDKTLFLNDSAAIMNFGLWMMKEKYQFFFQMFKMT